MIRMIPCRNTTTGARAELPETALQHFPAFERLDEQPTHDTPPGPEPADDTDKPAHPSKAATGAAKKTKE